MQHQTTPLEQWRAVVDHPGSYEVSDLGRVRRNGRILIQQTNRLGYKQIGIWWRRECKRRYVHHLVADAFIRPRQVGEQINHQDGDKANNYATNLEWVSPQSNIIHAYRAGLATPHSADHKGERNPRAGITDEQARTIRAMKGLMPQRKVAALLNVPVRTVKNIWGGYTWKHV